MTKLHTEVSEPDNDEWNKKFKFSLRKFIISEIPKC